MRGAPLFSKDPFYAFTNILINDIVLQKENLHSSTKTKRRKEMTEFLKQSFHKKRYRLKQNPAPSLLVFIARGESDSKQRHAQFLKGGLGFGKLEKGWK